MCVPRHAARCFPTLPAVLIVLALAGRSAGGEAPSPERLQQAAPAGISPELLTNGGFEGAYSGLAPGWAENTWAAPGDDQRRYVSRGPETQSPHGGQAAQRISVARFAAGGGTALLQNFDFPAGRVYEGRVWLRAASPMKVRVLFRKRSFYYNTGAARVLSVGSAWQEVVIRGGYPTDTPGEFFIQPVEPGTLYVDDASLSEVTTAVLHEPPASHDPLPRTFFGMHVNKLGTHNTWPPLTFGTLRLWDTGTYWAAVEPARGALLQDENWQSFPRPASA